MRRRDSSTPKCRPARAPALRSPRRRLPVSCRSPSPPLPYEATAITSASRRVVTSWRRRRVSRRGRRRCRHVQSTRRRHGRTRHGDSSYRATGCRRTARECTSASRASAPKWARTTSLAATHGLRRSPCRRTTVGSPVVSRTRTPAWAFPSWIFSARAIGRSLETSSTRRSRTRSARSVVASMTAKSMRRGSDSDIAAPSRSSRGAASSNTSTSASRMERSRSSIRRGSSGRVSIRGCYSQRATHGRKRHRTASRRKTGLPSPRRGASDGVPTSRTRAR